MKILVLQGSLKGEKGITELLVKKFLNGIIKGEPSCSIDVEYLCRANIKICRGCFNCWVKTPGICSLDDDMGGLIKKYKEADIIIAAAPLYFDNMSSHMKGFWERMLPLMDPHFEAGPLKVRHCMKNEAKKGLFVISTCAFPEIMQFDALVLSFKRIAYNLKMDYLGHLLRPECHSLTYLREYKDKIETVLNYVEIAGEELIKNLSVSRQTVEGVQQPISGNEEEFIKINNDKWDKALKRQQAK